ncbi:hypothetical protein I204_02031 [Kwoniella mangroviensis CBS 8886]|uniref:uncharacterized protein n=1 Tax=Kwoniella mangroviensis CBS 8507 TaxID=1296122 RepID=UPI00080D27D0|nr:uncharacterized protein I203_03662 [Kwoniella mangroviensis CBS 8507]OCF66980.1 hypothetical protein I203_03662 [Kwoniella mangroviensis CBS 8507]OCF78025.1 hypothetical protein I204_02031 [Kwoniella mangroviensis CBS 8886]
MHPRALQRPPFDADRSPASISTGCMLPPPLPSSQVASTNTPLSPYSPPLATPPASQVANSGSPVATRTRRQVHLTPSGREFWKDAKIHWNNDGSSYTPSSEDLLVDWLQIPGNWKFFFSGYKGGTQSKGAKRCSEQLYKWYCPTVRTPKACQKKLTDLHDDWVKAYDLYGKRGTGQGDMGYRPEISSENEHNDIIDTEAEKLKLCPRYDVLTPIFQPSEGGSVANRGDTGSTISSSRTNTPSLLDRFTATFSQGERALSSVPGGERPLDDHPIESDFNMGRYRQGDTDTEDNEDGPETASITTSRSGFSKSISDNLSGSRSRVDQALIDNAEAIISKEAEYREKRLRNAEDTAERDREYQEKRIRLEEDRIELKRAKNKEEAIAAWVKNKAKFSINPDIDALYDQAEDWYMQRYT